MIRTITNLFPIWAILFSGLAFIQPDIFVGLKASIVPLLTIIMLAMGLTLTPKDFSNIRKNIGAVTTGIVLQFSVMPLVALAIAMLLNFDADLTVGLVLVGCVAGGTSSNVMCFLAKGDVALSITMTAISTLLGVLLTPLLVETLAGKAVDIPVTGMIISLVKVVLVPVLVGVFINSLFHKYITKLNPILPLISMAAIVMIIAIVVALNSGKLIEVGPMVALAVVLHNSAGLLAGYWIPKKLGFDEKICRTIAFEVGLQNSGLATALAMKFFAPTAAIAGTIFSVWHNISGSILAGYWAKSSVNTSAKNTQEA
ncbi:MULTISPECIES: bile acid:sodium symporter family protein [Vibrio]|uniref:Bile acid:sodium symporter family protein n=1 Tax=Vibrio casei TaxID=673372 RepID=A0A368LHB4_9VIBR|nr:MULTISPECIES: bile acid:sodium symporter family protein [Vibrio]RCS70015.1 bile acid:sodium symporter family protein [Vibrio casei]SJN33789.1 Sodium-dependent transporter [Vibrio casei]HBV77465.1 bile acid:sodium symporter family protein [Vibrio sp.]